MTFLTARFCRWSVRVNGILLVSSFCDVRPCGVRPLRGSLPPTYPCVSLEAAKIVDAEG